MPCESILLTSREQRIVNLLLQAYSDAEIAAELNMRKRTVKAYLNRLFLRFGIRSGIKRVKLATLLYRHELQQASTLTIGEKDTTVEDDDPDSALQSSLVDSLVAQQ